MTGRAGLVSGLLRQRDGDRLSKWKPSYLPKRDTGQSCLCSVLKCLVRSIQRPHEIFGFHFVLPPISITVPIGSAGKMSMRSAQASDLDAITWVSVAATPADPLCSYRYPYREQYPEDFQQFSRIRLSEFLAEAATGSTLFMVYEAPSMEDPSIRKVISYAIWELPKGHVERPKTRTLSEVGKQCMLIFGALVQYYSSLLTLGCLTTYSGREAERPF